jgi:hypothetical protein
MARLRAKMREPRARPRAPRDLEIHKLKAEIQELRAKKSAQDAEINSVINVLRRHTERMERELRFHKDWAAKESWKNRGK